MLGLFAALFEMWNAPHLLLALQLKREQDCFSLSMSANRPAVLLCSAGVGEGAGTGELPQLQWLWGSWDVGDRNLQAWFWLLNS